MGNEVRQYRSSTKEYSEAITFGRRAQAIDVDVGRKLLYWMDTSLRRIERAAIPDDPKIAGVPQDLEIGDIQQPEGLAIDWVAK